MIRLFFLIIFMYLLIFYRHDPVLAQTNTPPPTFGPTCSVTPTIDPSSSPVPSSTTSPTSTPTITVSNTPPQPTVTPSLTIFATASPPVSGNTNQTFTYLGIAAFSALSGMTIFLFTSKI